ncbi:MAG TPA: hypothetical protein VLY87_07970 [Flavobacterium sp.]|nr:hypothetical protein [Flavobacterium sp.]
MNHNGKDTSGNAFKYSLIPLFLGIVLTFFLYRSCKNSVYEPKPQTTTTVVETEQAVPAQQPETVTTEDSAVENDTVQAVQ